MALGAPGELAVLLQYAPRGLTARRLHRKKAGTSACSTGGGTFVMYYP